MSISPESGPNPGGQIISMWCKASSRSSRKKIPYDPWARIGERETTNVEMEFPGRHTSCLSSQHENSSWAANKEGSNDTELEVVAEEYTNGAAEEARDNMLLVDDNLWFLQRQKERIERQVFYSCVLSVA